MNRRGFLSGLVALPAALTLTRTAKAAAPKVLGVDLAKGRDRSVTTLFQRPWQSRLAERFARVNGLTSCVWKHYTWQIEGRQVAADIFTLTKGDAFISHWIDESLLLAMENDDERERFAYAELLSALRALEYEQGKFSRLRVQNERGEVLGEIALDLSNSRTISTVIITPSSGTVRAWLE